MKPLPLNFTPEPLIADQIFETCIANAGDSGVVVTGSIIPGLIAIWFDRQGILETLTTLTAASVVVRIIILIFGTEILAL